ncbi:MAG: pyrroline-5-carboxylate reductase [Clostridia bacterium]|nr:pyrroline-5-carboxylate reductase [Clostridia bacterium]
MKLNKKIAFIGAGFMAGAMIDGILSGEVADNTNIYIINEAFPEVAAEAAEKYGVNHGKPSDIGDCEVIVFGIKPQVFPETVEMYGEYFTADKLYLSIMAGISTEKLEAATNDGRVVRLMPNMPLSVGESATVYVLGKNCTEAEGEITEAIFAPLGLIRRVEENMISAVTALSGSGPAYFCRLAEAMVKAAAEYGMDEKLALELAVQTLIGTAETIKKTGVDPATLRTRVTSKKGTTEAALNAMTDTGFDKSVAAAFDAARKRSDELGK